MIQTGDNYPHFHQEVAFWLCDAAIMKKVDYTLI